MQITTQALVRFMDKLAQFDRYFRVDEFKISNTDLHQPDPPLTVEMVLTQAYFRPSKKGAAAAADGGEPAAVNQRLTSLFGGAADPTAAARGSKSVNEKPEPSAWQQFRRKWLPF